ncbi:MAG: hypothetical protein IJH75_01690 [Mogibacterium sp.]|nr:hypothetical protein [Mogibacterium sp.]
MASIGLKRLAWAQMASEPDNGVPTYGAGMILGKAVSTSLSITTAEGELYADDMLAEYVSEFSSAQLTAEADNIPLDKQAMLYGAAYSGGEMQMSADDTPPYGGWGGYQVLMVGGVRKYRTWFFPKGKANIPDWNGATKGANVSFGTQPIDVKVMAPNFGPWYYVKEFDNEAAASAYIDSKLNVSTWYNVDVQLQGSGSAVPGGSTPVAAGEDYTLTITGTVSKLYDNGTDKTASISEGVYTIADVAADHNIAIIFS